MAGVLSGNFALAKFIHPLDNEDGDNVGPGAYTLQSGATIQSTAKDGNALECTGASDALDSDSALSGIDSSDTAKTLVHVYWNPDAISGLQVFLNLMNSAKTLFMMRVLWDTGSMRALIQWRRSVVFPSTSAFVAEINCNPISPSVGVFSSFVFYVNAATTDEGRVYFNGLECTADKNKTNIGGTANIASPFVRVGNAVGGGGPARIIDHPTIIQDPLLTDARVDLLVDQYDDTLGFGYFMDFGSQSPASAEGGDTVSIFGTGFGKDVTVTIGGKIPPVINRIDQGHIQIKVPNGLNPGPQPLVITNVLSGVILTVATGFTISAADDEQLRLILRGERNGMAHPICEFKVIADNGDEIILEGEVKRKEVVLRRDDRRTSLARFVPSVQSLDVTLKNDQKQFTRGFGGTFDGLLVQGQVVIPRMGFLVNGVRDLREFGKFRIDDVEFNNSPPAEARIQCRDLLSAALDQEISMRSFTGTASAYVIEILSKVGIITEGSEKEISIPTTTTTVTSTPVVTKTRALDILSEVLALLQAEANYRLIQDIDGIIKLVVVPSSGFSDQSFHWLKDLAAPYTQKERANQSSLRTTIVKSDPPSVAEDVNLFEAALTEADFTGSPKQKIISFSKAIRIIGRTPEDLTQDFKVIEVARTTTSLTLEMENPSDTGTINVLIRGDTTSDIVGESGSGKDQGGVGFGNEIDRQKRRRGRTREIQVRFVANDSEAQDVSDIIQIRYGDPASEQDFGVTFAPIRTKLNDLVRIIEKFSDSRDLQSVSQITLIYEAGDLPGSGDSFTGNLIVLDAGIQEPVPNYDLAFFYDRGLIYDDRLKIGDVAGQNLSFRGAVVVDL